MVSKFTVIGVGLKYFPPYKIFRRSLLKVVPSLINFKYLSFNENERAVYVCFFLNKINMNIN